MPTVWQGICRGLVRAAYRRGDQDAVWRWVGLSGRNGMTLPAENVALTAYLRFP